MYTKFVSSLAFTFILVAYAKAGIATTNLDTLRICIKQTAPQTSSNQIGGLINQLAVVLKHPKLHSDGIKAHSKLLNWCQRRPEFLRDWLKRQDFTGFIGSADYKKEMLEFLLERILSWESMLASLDSTSLHLEKAGYYSDFRKTHKDFSKRPRLNPEAPYSFEVKEWQPVFEPLLAKICKDRLPKPLRKSDYLNLLSRLVATNPVLKKAHDKAIELKRVSGTRQYDHDLHINVRFSVRACIADFYKERRSELCPLGAEQTFEYAKDLRLLATSRALTFKDKVAGGSFSYGDALQAALWGTLSVSDQLWHSPHLFEEGLAYFTEALSTFDHHLKSSNPDFYFAFSSKPLTQAAILASMRAGIMPLEINLNPKIYVDGLVHTPVSFLSHDVNHAQRFYSINKNALHAQGMNDSDFLSPVTRAGKSIKLLYEKESSQSSMIFLEKYIFAFFHEYVSGEVYQTTCERGSSYLFVTLPMSDYRVIAGCFENTKRTQRALWFASLKRAYKSGIFYLDNKEWLAIKKVLANCYRYGICDLEDNI